MHPVGQPEVVDDALLAEPSTPLVATDAPSDAHADTRIETDKHNSKFLIFMIMLPLVVIKKMHGLSARKRWYAQTGSAYTPFPKRLHGKTGLLRR